MRLLTRFLLCILVAAPMVHVTPRVLGQSALELATDQAELARKFEQLEALAKRIAELTESEDPARAEQLRGAIRKSQELELSERFEAIVGLLRGEQLAAASKDQQALADQLDVLLRLLLSDPRQAQDEAERKRLKEALKEIDRQIRAQDQLRTDSTENAGGDNEELLERQEALAKEAGALSEGLSPAKQGQQPSQPSEGSESQPGSEGESGEQQSGQQAEQDSPKSPQGEKEPSKRAAERIAAAKEKMMEAAKELEESNRDEAQDKQAEALWRLEEARQEIEEALRQLREEEQMRRLTALSARLRGALSEQIDIHELTRQAEEDRPNRGRRATEIAARGLANREDELIKTIDGALRLLREDGSSIAYPEVLEQVREDMVEVSSRVRKTKLSSVTQTLQKEIITSLEEALESLDKTIEDLQQQQQDRQQGGESAQQGDPQVVDSLAELRMIRAIQARILRRTSLWNGLQESGELSQLEVDKALDLLSARQARLMRALRNVGKHRQSP